MGRHLWGNDATGINVDGCIAALAWFDEKHPSGKDHLVRVSYLYVAYNGWIRRERITLRDPFKD